MSDDQPKPKRRIEPWAVWPFVFFVVLIAVHMVFIARMTSADASSVEANAYEASAHYDQDLAAIERFEAMGLHLVAEPGAEGQVSVRIDGGADLRDAQLDFYRPGSAGLDQVVAWDDPASDLHLALPRDGRWRVTLTATTVDGEAVRAARELSL